MGWYNSSWFRRKSITINGSSAGSQANYQIPFVIFKGSGTDSGGNIYCGGNSKNDFGDIRFTQSDGSTALNYWLDPNTFISGTSVTAWVKIPSIPASPSTVTIYIYYNNPSATDASSGPNTFLLFDDFNNNTLTNWTEVINVKGTYSATNQRLQWTNPNTNTILYGIVKGSASSTINFVMEWIGQNIRSDYPQARMPGWVVYTSSSQYIAYAPWTQGHWWSYPGYSPTINTDNDFANAFHAYKLVYDGSHLKQYVDGTLYTDITVTLASTIQVGISNAGGGGAGGEVDYTDNWRVRNYASPEPSWASSGTEQVFFDALLIAGD